MENAEYFQTHQFLQQDLQPFSFGPFLHIRSYLPVIVKSVKQDDV